MNDLNTENLRLEESRAVPRIAASVRVQSPTLPNYFATTLDVARHGMQVQTASPLEVGVEMEFCLHLPTQETLTGVGVVRWTARSKPFRAGLEFIYLEADQSRTLERFLQEKVEDSTDQEPPTAPSQVDYLESEIDLEAILVEAIENEDQLILTLLEEDQAVRWHFPHPSRVEGQIQHDKLETLQVRPGPRDRFEFRFLGPGQRPILSFRSRMPHKQAS